MIWFSKIWLTGFYNATLCVIALPVGSGRDHLSCLSHPLAPPASQSKPYFAVQSIYCKARVSNCIICTANSNMCYTVYYQHLPASQSKSYFAVQCILQDQSKPQIALHIVPLSPVGFPDQSKQLQHIVHCAAYCTIITTFRLHCPVFAISLICIAMHCICYNVFIVEF